MLDLVRDVLDKQLLDIDGRRFGKVDGIVLDIRADGAPRVLALEVGAATRLGRLPHWLARPLAWWRRRTTTTRIPREAVLAVGRDLRVAIDATATPAWRVEAWLSRLFAHIPGGR